MTREVRRVPVDLVYPSDETGIQPWRSLYGCTYVEATADWDVSAGQWMLGLKRNYVGGKPQEWIPLDEGQDYPYADFAGARPDDAGDYMPAFPEGTATYFQMYCITSEGSPISPVFPTPEELASWLADSDAKLFANERGTYEHWLAIARGGPTPDFVFSITGPV